MRSTRSIKRLDSEVQSANKHDQPNIVAERSTSYDRSTGLVYTDIEVTGTLNTTWIYDYKTPAVVRRTNRANNGPGCRSLYDMLIIKLGFDAQELSIESLQGVPWKLGRGIWHRVAEIHAESYYLWRTFALAYPRGFTEREYTYTLDIRAPSLALSDYRRGITSGNLSWLTALRISPKQISLPDLVALHEITNLIALDLSDGQLHVDNRQSPFDIRVMRTWSELARQRHAFQYLEVLCLGWQEKLSHDWIFEYLKWFPRLKLLVMTDCRQIDHKNHREWEDTAQSYDWAFMPAKRGVKRLRALYESPAGRAANMLSLVYEVAMSNEHALPSKPVLECWLGTPRAWNHIIDEFPGTRTVVFERVQGGERVRPDDNQNSPNPPKVKRECGNPGTIVNTNSRDENGPRRKSSKLSAAGLLAQMR